MIESIYNFRQFSPNLATAGQPNENELHQIGKAGYEVVINLGLDKSEYSVRNEKKIIESYGIQYMHIPVNFETPEVEKYRAFARFLKKYPNDPLAPNAQYWLGEANYVSQKNAEAQKAFELVVSRYPDSTKAPGALFKIGRLQQAAGNNGAARASFERVLQDYPDSPAAGLARQRLGQLGAGR